ncbi:TetR/AcrR family transcriptional regulator [Streptomyces sp. NPDC102340]|uniref:TetR/AcrR family transcriptional regulator n=1 Tax=unclassified Streptomyces TaxID=2593676 RepID=UPI00380D92C9
MATRGTAEGTRKRDAAATRQALLTAAHDRFIRLGYEGTKLRDVAADAGVTLALVKRYFGSKEGLFKAALAVTPRGLGRDGDSPRDPTSLAEALSRQLASDSWPEFSEHPVLMLLRASGDAQVDALRRQALLDAARQALAASDASDGDDAAHGDDTERLLRAELLIALGVGVAVLRSTVGIQPLQGASADELVGPLRDVTRALLTPTG